MKKKYLMAMVLAFLCFNVNAQNIEGFEGCGDGTYPGGWWNPWGGCTWDCYFLCADDIVHTGEWAGMMPSDETTDIVLDLGNKIFGEWGLGFWMYVPSNREAYFNLQGTIPIGAGEWIVGNIYFNHELLSPGVGLIDDTATGEVYFDFPHDEWFRVIMNVDISGGIGASTWEFNVDNTEVVPAGTPFTDSAGTYPTSLGGVDFFSISTDCEWYIDDIEYTDSFIDPSPFTDDMEYTGGYPTNPWWTCWTGTNCAPFIAGPGSGAHSGQYMGHIPNDATTDAILDFGNQTAGEWGLEFWMYIPSGNVGYFNLQGVVPVGAGEWIVGNFYFGQPIAGHAGTLEGYIDDTALGGVDFNFPYDTWFNIVFNVDITGGIGASTWQMGVNGVEIVPAGTPFTDFAGTYPTSLGGIDFFSIDSTNYYYMDDFNYVIGFLPLGAAGIEDETFIDFTIYPNPVQGSLQIETQEQISGVKIYGQLGNLILESTSEKILDVSQLSAGMYFVEVSTPNGRSTQKFIKE